MRLNVLGSRFKSPRPKNLQPASIATLSGARGVTLVELVIVVAMIMIVSAFAVPRIQAAIRTYHLTAATTSFGSAIQTTRYQAIMKGYYYKVSFNSGNRTFQVANKVPPAVVFSNVGNPILWSTTSDVTMSPTTTLYFSPGGMVSTTAPPTLTLGNVTLNLTNGVLTKTITVSSVGNVNVQ